MPRDIHFFVSEKSKIYAVRRSGALDAESIAKLEDMTGAKYADADLMTPGAGHIFVGPKSESVSPWSTNATEGARNIGLAGVERIEEFSARPAAAKVDRMLSRAYRELGQDLFDTGIEPAPIRYLRPDELEQYNIDEGLALSPEEIAHLKSVAEKEGRDLTDSEIFMFAQVNSEHCRHKIFNGRFIIDGKEMPETLFDMIKQTTAKNPGLVLSAYKDNAAVVAGPRILQWAPGADNTMELTPIQTGFTIKAETHNFPTTVAAFPGAATGAGGEIRDRFGVGRGSIPLAGSAFYFTSYTRTGKTLKPWEDAPRQWLYQSPQEISTRASNGASDFGNKFGQPLINGKNHAFEHAEGGVKYGGDKAIMLAGGVGYVDRRYALKDESMIKVGQRVLLLGGDNYRIGLGGGSVSSLNTGDAASAVELNAVQRANAEMQKRAFNLVRALTEAAENPIVSIHDHGAGGHGNCLPELLEHLGGRIDMGKLPIGDKTLSAREIIGNESQERMAILVDAADVDAIMKIAAREQCPCYDIGEITGDHRIVFEMENGERPVDLPVKDFIGNAPRTIMTDNARPSPFKPFVFTDDDHLIEHIKNVLTLPGVGSKDFLTNKVDRSVTGKVARQQAVGELQIPLSDYGLVKYDFDTDAGIAMSMGLAPQAAMIDPGAGSRLAIARALTNAIFAPLGRRGLGEISLSANWQWPCRNPGEDARLYKAVRAASDFVQALQANIPTGKDSLSMKQKYPGGDAVLTPGTLVVSAAGNARRLDRAVGPVMEKTADAALFHIDMSGVWPRLGGSALAQTLRHIGSSAPDVDPKRFAKVFQAVQKMVKDGIIMAGHDISEGGLITTILEMTFAHEHCGVDIDIESTSKLFAENPGVVVQIANENIAAFERALKKCGAEATRIGKYLPGDLVKIRGRRIDMAELRDAWMTHTREMEPFQNNQSDARRKNLLRQPLVVDVAADKKININIGARKKATAAVLRDKGTNGEREMLYAAHLGGFRVKDVAVADLASGAEDLRDTDLLILAGGFSNSDVIAAGKLWADAMRYNARANNAIANFYARPGTLSLGVCNGCQVMMELGVIGGVRAPMRRNESGKFESAFVSATIPENNSVMMRGLAGMTLPIWIAHGEGRFDLPADMRYQKVLEYYYKDYPGNPNGSPDGLAGIASTDGRHLAMMPHPERAILPHQWPFGADKIPAVKLANDRAVMPWLAMFSNAYSYSAGR
ncbi:MAG: phosphoribosylformylglycinamidine synthase [Rickettsiales bacterium]|jgi:phosphoribosylformylglycinamidine synthase|nr:phosphoribosylformylglycinamidine synthase [Rickettsiales bacterium]